MTWLPWMTIIAASMVACASEETAPLIPEYEADYAIVNVALVPMTRPEIRIGQTVLVDDGKIVHIGPDTASLLPPAVERIDGSGLYLAPGLADMHVHIEHENDLVMNVTHGVTTVRNMWGTAETLALRERLERGEIIGPTIFTAGPIIDGPPKTWPESVEVDSAAAAVAEVNRQVETGYDFLKIYSNLSPEAFFAILQRSKQLGRPVAGHIPEAVPIEQALGAGMDSMEHLLGFDRATTIPGIDMGDNRYRSPERIVLGKRVLSGDLTFDEIYDAGRLQALVNEIAASDTWVVPTLIVQKNLYAGEEEVQRQFARSEMKYVSKEIRDFWDPANDFRRASLSEDDLAALRAFHTVSRARVAALHVAGAKLLAGSDAPNPFVFHGLSLHEELQELERAGLDPYDAIAAATVSAAHFFGESSEWGGIEEGARADLVLLAANPLDDAANYLKIRGVMLRGVWYDHEELATMKASVAADVGIPMFAIPGKWD